MPRLPRGLDVNKPSATKIAQAEPETKHTSKKGKKAKTKSVRKTYSTMDYDELKVAKDQYKASKNYETTAKYLERMITLCDDKKTNEKAEIIIELADLLFDQEKFDDAAKHYTEFIKLYPGNKNIEYASYRAIVCCSKKILSPDRDQSKTEETIALADKFLERADVFTTYEKEVRTIQQQCYQVLAASELNVSSFYIIHGDFKAAQQRLAHVRTEWLGKVPEIEFSLASLEVDLAEKFPEFKPTTPLSAAAANVVVAQTSTPKKVDLAKRF